MLKRGNDLQNVKCVFVADYILCNLMSEFDGKVRKNPFWGEKDGFRGEGHLRN